ncbi:MAG TPA: molybdate ABC transporter substrate-binding protein [Solirubrobacterales bacterium]|nr:molybdate ABC transporter substrate-binding protein [Solirubrobacterales bacterium]
MRRLGACAAAAAIALAGCGEDDEEEAPDELTVSAAASLTEPFEAYGETTESEERFSFAGSDELAAQIRKGAPVDVFASADTSLPDDLFQEALVEEPEIFISNQLVLAVPSDSNIASIGDLVRDDIDLVIGADGVPVGDYTREVLGGLDSGIENAILANVRSEEPDVKSIVGKLVAGAADAGFVYASDVNAAGEDLTAIELPEDLEPVVTYGVAVHSDAENPEGAQEFIDSLVDGEAHQLLLDADFLEPPQE